MSLIKYGIADGSESSGSNSNADDDYDENRMHLPAAMYSFLHLQSNRICIAHFVARIQLLLDFKNMNLEWNEAETIPLVIRVLIKISGNPLDPVHRSPVLVSDSMIIQTSTRTSLLDCVGSH